MIKCGTFTQVRGYDQKSNWRNTQIYHQGLISAELRNSEVINRQGLLDLLKRFPEIGAI